jgi:hypothetical protein
MLKEILSLKGAQSISKIEQRTIATGIPQCWISALEAGCILIRPGEICPLDTESGICDSNRICC